MNITLTTYGSGEEGKETEIEFTMDNQNLETLVKKNGWKNKREFLSNYTYDSSEPIYEQAKILGMIIDEKEIPSCL